MSIATKAHVEAAREKAQSFVDDHLGGDEAAKAAVEQKSFRTADRANIGAMRVVSLVVALTVGAIVASFLLPIGLEELVSVDTANYSSGAAALWGILDVIIVLALFLFFIAVALAAADRV